MKVFLTHILRYYCAATTGLSKNQNILHFLLTAQRVEVEIRKHRNFDVEVKQNSANKDIKKIVPFQMNKSINQNKQVLACMNTLRKNKLMERVKHFKILHRDLIVLRTVTVSTISYMVGR